MRLLPLDGANPSGRLLQTTATEGGNNSTIINRSSNLFTGCAFLNGARLGAPQGGFCKAFVSRYFRALIYSMIACMSSLDSLSPNPEGIMPGGNPMTIFASGSTMDSCR